MSLRNDDQLILTLKRPFKAYKNRNSTFESPKINDDLKRHKNIGEQWK